METIERGSGLVDMKRLEREINEIQQKPYSDEMETTDPFNRLWSVVEPMMDKLSDSVKNSESIDSITIDEKEDGEEANRLRRDLLDALQDCLPSSTQDDRSALQEAKTEYEKLCFKLNELQNKIQILEKKSMDNTALKSSIMQFKNDVHKQAKILLQSQEHSLMTRSAMSTGRPPIGHSTAEMVNRIKELEEKNKNLKSQNRKLDVHMEKYRERFDKLKEGAKKRTQQDI